MMKQLLAMVLVIFLIDQTYSQMSTCVSPDNLLNLENYELETNQKNGSFYTPFDSTFWLTSRLPISSQVTENGYGYRSMSSKFYIIQLDMENSLLGQRFSTEVKISKYKQEHADDIDLELSLASDLSKANPILFQLYFNCAYDSSTLTFFTMSEFMQGDVGDRSYQKLLKTDLQKLKQMNLMARALLDVHLRGYVHNNINLNSYVYTTRKRNLITKLTNFGYVNYPGNPARAGDIEFAAPEVFEDDYESSRKADLYSLGLVYYIMLYGSYGIYYGLDENPIANKTFREHVLKERVNIINKATYKEEDECEEDEKNDCSIIKVINGIIRVFVRRVQTTEATCRR